MKVAERARRIPTFAAAERVITAMVTREHHLPIADYDAQNVTSIVAQLPTVSQRELRRIAAYESKHENRVPITTRITGLTSTEPWRGYDGQNVAEITATLATHDADSVREVGSYERAHKDRAGVRAAVEHHAA
jgi:hypothetical protein